MIGLYDELKEIRKTWRKVKQLSTKEFEGDALLMLCSTRNKMTCFY
jgi:hypothetical protein